MGKSVTLTPPILGEAEADSISGRGDPDQRYRVYRLCLCPNCDGCGKQSTIVGLNPKNRRTERCAECRGEGKKLDLVATCADAPALGTLIVELGREGEWAECPIGVLDTEGEKGKKWILLPWLPSPRNVSDAGRVLAGAKRAAK